jgi:hypothetical protein
VFDGHYRRASVNWKSCLAYTLAMSMAMVSPAEAKCARLLLKVTGEVRGDDLQELVLRIETVPDANARQQAPVREGANFTAELLFDPTKGYGRLRGHDCSRRPKLVRVLLLRRQDVVHAKELSFATEFIEESMGQYRLRAPLILDGTGDATRR